MPFLLLNLYSPGYSYDFTYNYKVDQSKLNRKDLPIVIGGLLIGCAQVINGFQENQHEDSKKLSMGSIAMGTTTLVLGTVNLLQIINKNKISTEREQGKTPH